MFCSKALDVRREVKVNIINIAGIRVSRTRASLLRVEKNPYLLEDFEYFEELKIKRGMEYFDFSTIYSKLYKRQRGRCPICSEVITFGDKLEIDHIQPLSKGGKDTLKNMRILHKTCHKEVTKGLWVSEAET